MVERDKNDASRETAPCVPADDAVFIDNSELTQEETLAQAISIIKEKLKRSMGMN